MIKPSWLDTVVDEKNAISWLSLTNVMSVVNDEWMHDGPRQALSCCRCAFSFLSIEYTKVCLISFVQCSLLHPSMRFRVYPSPSQFVRISVTSCGWILWTFLIRCIEFFSLGHGTRNDWVDVFGVYLDLHPGIFPSLITCMCKIVLF